MKQMELFISWNQFFRLHRDWLLKFFRDELSLIILGMVSFILAGKELLFDMNHPSLFWLFLIFPTLAQTMLAIKLGTTFNIKSSSAWEMRLPFRKGRASKLSYSLIILNACLLFFPLYLIWIPFYEVTSYPVAAILILIPCLTFQITRQVDDYRSGVSIGIASAVVLGLLSCAPFFWFGIVHSSPLSSLDSLQINPPLDINVLFLGFSLFFIFLADQDRRQFVNIILVITISTSIFIGIENYRKIRFHQTSYYRKLREVQTQSEVRIQKCKEYASDFYQSPILEKQRENNRFHFAKNNVMADQYFNTKEQLFQGLEAVGHYPSWTISRKELIQLWADLARQPSIRENSSVLLQANDCALVQLYNYLIRMIPGISGLKELIPRDRKTLAEGVWKSISQIIDQSVTLMPALIGANLVQKMLDCHLIEGVTPELIHSLTLDLEEIKKTNQVSKSKHLVLTPTEKRLQEHFKTFFNDEIKPTSELVNHLVELKKEIHLSKWLKK